MMLDRLQSSEELKTKIQLVRDLLPKQPCPLGFLEVKPKDVIESVRRLSQAQKLQAEERS